MKKLLAFSLIFGISGACFADAIMIKSVTQFTSPFGQSFVSAGGLEFNPGTNKIVFRIANKACTFNSSGNPWGAGKGCTYALTVDNSTNQIYAPASNGNACTPASQMVAACK